MAIGGTGGTARDLDPGRFFTSDPFQADPASEQLANLSRLQWQQGANLMYPAQSQLIQYAEDPNYIAAQRQQALGDVNQSFAAQGGARQRLMGLMGVMPTQAQSMALNKGTALAKAAAEAGAMNQATQLAAKNQQGVMQGFS
ncbi:hypothetical protein [Nevskia soli]|uniref:hypothetical protein n=1 Tax=Nevskia soli TaxID=418856 RepID=UPI0004A74042|nr:hypothetical protein [Nevskia soli]